MQVAVNKVDLVFLDGGNGVRKPLAKVRCERPAVRTERVLVARHLGKDGGFVLQQLEQKGSAEELRRPLTSTPPHLIGEGAQQVLDNHHVFTDAPLHEHPGGADAVLVEQQALTQPHVRRQVELEKVLPSAERGCRSRDGRLGEPAGTRRRSGARTE